MDSKNRSSSTSVSRFNNDWKVNGSLTGSCGSSFLGKFNEISLKKNEYLTSTAINVDSKMTRGPSFDSS